MDNRKNFPLLLDTTTKYTTLAGTGLSALYESSKLEVVRYRLFSWCMLRGQDVVELLKKIRNSGIKENMGWEYMCKCSEKGT